MEGFSMAKSRSTCTLFFRFLLLMWFDLKFKEKNFPSPPFSHPNVTKTKKIKTLGCSYSSSKSLFLLAWYYASCAVIFILELGVYEYRSCVISKQENACCRFLAILRLIKNLLLWDWNEWKGFFLNWPWALSHQFFLNLPARDFK